MGVIPEVQTVGLTPRSARFTYVKYICHICHIYVIYTKSMTHPTEYVGEPYKTEHYIIGN